MVSTLSISALIVDAAIALFLPIYLLVFYRKRERISFIPVLVGILVFILFSQILEKSLHFIVINPANPLIQNPIMYALYGAFAAGVFEEVGRYVGFSLFLKKYRERKDGIAFGLGHGGIEAILIGVIPFVTNVTFALMINQGVFDQTFAGKLPAETIAQIKTSLLASSPLIILLGGVERIFAVVLQIAMTLLVLYGVRQGKKAYLLYAILFHAMVDFIPALYQVHVAPFWLAEGVLVIATLVSVYYIKRTKASADGSGFFNR